MCVQYIDDLYSILIQIFLDFSWTKSLKENLSTVFKMSSFRFKQLEVMNATISGQDVFVVMPTGGGKSLCYQLPSFLAPGQCCFL